MSQPGMSYLDQVLDPSLPSSLSFLRNAHTKATTTSTTAYHHTDIPTTSSMDNSRPTLPMRRARAGTMPSLVHMPEERAHRSPLLRPSAVAAAAAAVDTRHRSGSLNLPVPPPMNLSFDNSVFGSSWSSMDREGTNGSRQGQQQGQQGQNSSLPSPSTEQLLRGDNDFSIARTLRSLGLEDDRAMGGENGNGTPVSTGTNNGLYHQQDQLQHHHQQQQQQSAEIHIPAQRSLLSGNRSRSYSVNATVRYQEPATTAVSSPSIHVATRTRASTISRTFANPLDNLTVVQQQNRPRASSMGRMDYGRSVNPPPVPSSLWQMQRLETLSDEGSDFPYGDSLKNQSQQGDNSLSLGDSELLANMLQKQTYPDTSTSAADHYQESGAFTNGNGPAEPYLHFSQSTPTFRNHQVQMAPSTSTPTQAATRSLWIGNIDATVSVDNLTHLFSSFGHIESVRLLLEKECAFVNFFHVEDAIRAKEEVLGRLGGRIGNCIVRIGFGRADAAVPDTTAHQPTRALWLGNIPPGTAPSTLLHIFSSFGTIESVRVLSHKNCGFVNFEYAENASKARDALLQNEIGVQGFTGIRVGFAKVPPAKSNSADGASNSGSGGTKLQTSNDRATVNDGESWLADLWDIMKQFGADESSINLVTALEATSNYFDSIPPVPELGANRKFDASRLREIRKKLDNATEGTKEVEAIAYDCLDEIAELSSDYIGNTVVQRLFEKCTEETKTAMLEHIAPHLAAIGIHKNGTWAAQKIIDTIRSPDQVRLVCLHLKPYVPPLLLDQFGNYAVQCCLRLGDGNNQFIFDAIVEKLLNVAQGRFGARAMRGTLENQSITVQQQKFVAAALIQNAVSLAMNANGALLLSWLIDSSNLENRYSMLANRLVPQLTQMATHKLGSQMILKLFNQNHDMKAREIILLGLTNEKTLEEILADQVRGVSLIQKILSSSFISTEERDHLSDQIRPLLNNPQGAGHKKLLDELLALDGGDHDNNNNDDDSINNDKDEEDVNRNNNSNDGIDNDDDDNTTNDNNNKEQSTAKINGDNQ
ncbi:armadillo-type protein [Circinella umbellata]|nr:armadillo-type protein [Circinella umbellata]